MSFKNLKNISALIAFAVSTLEAAEIKSPNGNLGVEVYLEDGEPHYEVEYNGIKVLEKSPLGLETSIGSFGSSLTEGETNTRRLDERYELPFGKVSEVHYVANELAVQYSNAEEDILEIVFRVSDHDVAFCYRVLSEDRVRFVVEGEQTGFNLPDSATAFVTHQAKAGDGWMGTKPSYEEGYHMDVPVITASPTGLGFTFPALFRLEDNGWALVSETGVTSKYVGSRLADPSEEGMYRIAFPEPDENGGVGEANVAASLPFQSPWRTITFGESLAPIIASTVATDVVEPLYEPSMNYEPGRSTWSWLLWQDASMNEADQRSFIELAEELDFEYILVDALWDTILGREKLEALVSYANSKGVDVLLWYNSNGYWNDAPQGPRDRLDTAPARQREMSWLQSIGVKGLKVDFFGGDKQVTMKLYEDILTDGNKYGLHFNFHGATLPRGWARMYPNFMTSEAVTASENLVFSQGFADNEAWRSTVISIIRNPVAAMDYGPLILNPRFSKSPDSGNVRRTTDAFQLATAVLFYSPVQHFGVTPNNLDEQPSYVIDFLKQVPTAWDETRFMDGYPGDYVVLARRSGERWYVAATNGQDKPRSLTLDLSFLEGETLTLIHDRKRGRAAETKIVKIPESGSVDLHLGPQGGFVLYSP